VFDPLFDQAAGLRAVSMPCGVRCVPLVLSRDLHTAFDALCMLGDGLTGLGHGVLALAATSREKPGQPGLAHHPQLLARSARISAHGAHGPMGLVRPDGPEPAWRTLPSQAGLESLLHVASAQGPRVALRQLASVFTRDTVVLVLAPKEWVSVLFEDSSAQPLVPFVLQPAGTVDAYSAMKVLNQAGGLQPVLMPVVGASPSRAEQRSMSALLDTAYKHLRFTPECWPLQGEGQSVETVSPWMLRIVDSALMIDDEDSRVSPWQTPNQREALVPQLWSC